MNNMAHVKAGDAFWFISCSAADQPRESVYSVLRSRLEPSFVEEITICDVPLNLRFGAFDDLIRLADELTKHDTFCERVIRRIEKEILDINPSAELRIFLQRNTLTIKQYLYRFVWDEARYPKSRLLKENLYFLISSVRRISEEMYAKSAAYTEAKQLQENEDKRNSLTFTQKDLIDVLTPDIVTETDFIDTEHLTTLVVCVPRGMEKVWLAKYETFSEFVVPESTRNFNVYDKEKNTLWRVVLFKSSVEHFTTECLANKFHPIPFHYSPTGLSSKLKHRAKLNEEKDKQQSYMTRVCLASFSDAMIAWIHLKIMRVYVEGVLRYGVPPCFSTFLLKPLHAKEEKLKKELEDIFNKTQTFGRGYVQDANHGLSVKKLSSDFSNNKTTENEPYYSYVLYSFVPFQLFTQK